VVNGTSSGETGSVGAMTLSPAGTLRPSGSTGPSLFPGPGQGAVINSRSAMPGSLNSLAWMRLHRGVHLGTTRQARPRLDSRLIDSRHPDRSQRKPAQ
jgi:hypothetical protein